MATSVGEIEATLRLRDEMSAELRKAVVAAIGSAEDIKAAFSNASDGVKEYQQTLRELSGIDLLKQATLTAGAVREIGGAAALTGAEQKKVNAILTEALAKYKALGMEAPLGMRQLAEATAKVGPPTTFLQRQFGDLATQIKATALGFVSAQAIIGAVQNAFRMLVEFVSSSITAFAEQESAVKKLTIALQNQGDASPAVVDGMKAMATEFQNTTVYADELINEMQALLVEVGDVAPGQMKEALAAATDLASGLGIDLRNATMLVGKAFAGETSTLKRYGIVIDEAKLATEGASAVLEQIHQRFGGQAQGELDTYSGKVKALANAWGEVKEAVGEAIANDPLVQAGIRAVTDALKQQTKTAEEAHEKHGILREGLETSNNVARALSTGGFRLVIDKLYELAEASNEAQAALQRLNNLKPPPGFGGDTALPKPFGGGPDFNLMMEKALGAAKAVGVLTEKQKELAKVWLKSTDNAKDIAGEIGATEKATKKYIDAIKDAKKETEAYRREIEKLADEDLKRLIDSYDDFVDNLKRARTVMSGIPDGLNQIGQFPIDKIKESWNDWGESLKNINKVTAGLGKEFANIGEEGGDGIDRLEREATEALKAIDRLNRIGLAGFRNGLHSLAQALQGTILGDVFGGAAQIGDQINKLSSSFDVLESGSTSAMAKVGAGFAVIAQNVLIAYQTSKLVASIMEQIEHNAGNATRQFLRASGALTDMHLQLRMAGVDADELFNIKDELAFQAAFEKAQKSIRETNEAMEKYGLTWKDFSATTGDFVRYAAGDLIDMFDRLTGLGVDAEKVLKGMSGDLNQLIIDAVQTGKKVPAAMRPILEQLVRTKKLSEAAAAALLGIGEVGGPAFEDVMEAAQRYGIELDALGPKIRQLQIRDIAAQIVQDFNLLVEAGGDVNGILEGMKDEVQEVITSALKLGLELPESMRPIIEAMIRAGLLTDEFGNKLTDTSRLTFVEPLTDKIDELIDAIRELIDETDRYGQNAVNNFDRARNAAIALGKAVPRGFSSNPPGGGDTAQPRPDTRDGGTSTTPNPDADQIGEAARRGATTATVVINLEGRQIAEATLPYFAEEADRLGLT